MAENQDGDAPAIPGGGAAERSARRYYSISEVSELLEVKAHVLRYWETQFPYLRPRKNRGGMRMYQARDLDLLRSIKEMLYERGYTIAGAKQRLIDDRRKAAETERSQLEIDFISPNDRRKLREIRDELAVMLRGLQEPPRVAPLRRPRPEHVAPPADISVDRGEGGA